MFKRHDVITEEDVGDFIAELNRTIDNEVYDDDFEQLVRDSEAVAIRSQN
tara:strand:+ start:971 stop:1120 length:150 start_codon:yes stop_codon:yes gene_type:complete